MKALTPILLIWLVLVMGCGLGNILKRNTTSFDPYTGGLNELLPSEMSITILKFKLTGTRDTHSNYPDAKEAKGFTYMQEAGGIGVQLDGALVNFNSSAEANAQLSKIAAELNATVEKNSRGLNFTAEDRKTIGWTHGSIMCLVISSAGTKPASNFKEAAPF